MESTLSVLERKFSFIEIMGIITSRGHEHLSGERFRKIHGAAGRGLN
jgi:hypothetical protein